MPQEQEELAAHALAACVGFLLQSRPKEPELIGRLLSGKGNEGYRRPEGGWKELRREEGKVQVRRGLRMRFAHSKRPSGMMGDVDKALSL